MSSSESIAGLSLAISLLTFLWTIYRDWREQGRVRVNAYIGRVLTDRRGSKSVLGVHLVFQNIGSQSVFLKGWYVEIEENDGKHGGLLFTGSQAFNKKIEPGCAFDEFVPNVEFLKNRAIKTLFIEDRIGRKWYLSKKAFRKLIEESGEKVPMSI